MLPLSAQMPLRTTAEWPTTSKIEYIPHVYGKCTLAPIQYTEDRKSFVIADHFIGKVIAAYRDGSVESGFALRNTFDVTGHPVAIVDLTRPLADSATLTVQVIGKLSDTTGNAIETPSEVLFDVLQLIGHPVEKSRLNRLREDFIGWTIAGCLTGGITIRAQIQEIMASIGAAWALTIPFLAMAYPRDIDLTTDKITHFQAVNISDFQMSTESSVMATNILVEYAKEWGTGKLKSITLKVAEDNDPNPVEKKFPAHWLTDARSAFSVGSRILCWAAIPTWNASFTADLDETVSPGDWVEIECLPNVYRTAVAYNVETDWANGKQRIHLEFPSGEYPDIEIKQQTESFKKSNNALRITYANGIATILVLDESDNPVNNAIVTLDGNAVKTNKHGEAKFQTGRGLHAITIEAPGYSKLSTEVTI